MSPAPIHGRAASRRMPEALSTPGERVAIVDGLRSPFVKSWTDLNEVEPVQLSTQVCRELLFRNELDPSEVDHITWGTVVSVVHAPNVAREVALDLGMYDTPGFSVSRACASGFQAVVEAAQQILLGQSDVVIAGGVDVTSAAPVPHRKDLIDTLQKLQKARGLDRLATLAELNPADLMPRAPAIAERYTGKTMGRHAEDMAVHFDIPRAEQDALAMESHRKAAAAIAAGHMQPQVCPIITPRGVVARDNLVRDSMDPARVAKLKPVFDKRNGTITAASSSPLTDGASALLVMRESRARELGYEPLGFVRSWHFAGLDPRENMLLGNVYSSPFALLKAGLTLQDMDLVEIHEAFSVQVLSNLQCFDDADFFSDKLGLDAPLGALDRDKLNIWGGSIAYGHPFAATGGRILTNLLHALRHEGGELGLATACAAGGLGSAVVLQRA